MQSVEDTNQALIEDVASLKRVRARFSRSSDHKLRTVIPSLIPKLFQRLENYRSLIMDDNRENSKQISLVSLRFLDEAKNIINSILANAMQQLRRDENIHTDSFVRTVLPFIESNNPVVGTWTLSFLQILIQRIPLNSHSLISSMLPPVLHSLGQLHGRLTKTMEIPTINGPLVAQWVSVSWLLLDIIVLNSGHIPMVDWDINHFDSSLIPQRRVDDFSGMSINPESLVQRESLKESNSDVRCAARGFFSLILDVLLYWPNISPTNNATTLCPLGVHRMEHRSKTLLDDVDRNEDWAFPPAARQLELDMQQQLRHGRLGRGRIMWSDASEAYLRYMKLVCLEFAIAQQSTELFRDLNNDRAVVLSILFADFESMHGRLARSYLKKWSSKNPLVPISVATSILVLIVGESEAEELLDSFEKDHGSELWDHLIGPKSSSIKIRRPAIDWANSLRAANFLLENSFQWMGSFGSSHSNTSVCHCDTNDEARATLLVDLSLKLAERNDEKQKYIALRLISKFYCHLQRPKITMVSKIFDVIKNVLAVMVNVSIDEGLMPPQRNNDQIPGGVPRPFNNRNDLNLLLRNHRQSMRLKTLTQDDAIQARKEAYQLITLLSTFLFEGLDASRFHLPILLLQCSMFEDQSLENCLNKALDSTLRKYKEHFDEVVLSEKDSVSLQQQATFILPALLESVSSDATNARKNAIRWILKVLIDMDAEASHFLASHLVHDENSTISRMAKDVFDNAKKISQPMVVGKDLPVSFVDLNRNDGGTKILNDLKNRSDVLAQRLHIASCEESMILLLNFKFSVPRAEVEYRSDPVAHREFCGIGFDEKVSTGEETENDFCGICYEEIESNDAYSLQCGHQFCKSCWVSYATEASNEASLINFLDLRCPHHECNSRVMLRDLRRLEPGLVHKWNNALLKKFIEDDDTYRYCPGPDCGCVAIRSDQLSHVTSHSLKVTCDACTSSFCFGCGQNAHIPASCQDIARWNTLKTSSQFWIKQNSKPCPGCNIPIEKNQGCNHMQCTNCKTDFCWLCLTVLNSHLEPHTCNRYDSSDSTEDDFERQALFTATRYEAHDTAATFTMNQYNNFDPEKLLETYWFIDEDEDPEIMVKALKTLLDGREFLKNSYVAMLGLRGDRTRLRIHEENHACLEMFTERLSQLTETNLHRKYALGGFAGVQLHFRRLAIYTESVSKYMERMTHLN